MLKNKVLFIPFIFFITLTFLSRDIPFFWSGTFFSEQAVTFFNLGFNNFISPLDVDTGGFPLYSSYLTIVWKVFGKTLTVSHLALLPFMLGIVYEYYKLASNFLKDKMLWLAMVLLLIEPTFITQSILMAYDLLLVYFFLLALNSLIKNNRLLFLVAATLLCLSNVRGVFMLSALFIIDLIFQYQRGEKIKLSVTLNYLLPVLAVLCWALYHHAETGWYLVSPTRESYSEAFISFKMVFRQMFYSLWKIVDFGRVVLCIVVFIGSIYLFKRSENNQLKQILILVIVPAIVLVVGISTVGNPVGHRYFMVVFLLLTIATCFILQHIVDVRKRSLLFITICVALITGNFWIYPQRFGNGWDSSLKILSYFSLQKEVDQFIVQNKIDPNEIATQFPFVANTQFSYLTEESQIFMDVKKGPLNDYKYFLNSNLINSGLINELEVLKKDWTLLKEFKSGQIYISLYRNDKVVLK
jgi:4-amino-4-deoxy-L-arabinose transferase-like glycosyltransferase